MRRGSPEYLDSTGNQNNSQPSSAATLHQSAHAISSAFAGNVQASATSSTDRQAAVANIAVGHP
jgi:hypothetical protein